MTDEQRLCIECGCPVHYGSRHHHCGMVATKYMARISELERELADARKLCTAGFGAKLARALISIGDEPGWPTTRMAYKSRVGEVERDQGGMNEQALASFFQDFIDAAMRQEGE